jgi:hypothetical protein
MPPTREAHLEIGDSRLAVDTALVDFAEEARRFCRFVERASALSLPDRLREARARLAALYSAACHLPELFGDEVDAPDDPRPLPICNFGAESAYWEVFDPYELKEPVGADLDDDVGDVYCDVWRGLAMFDGGHPNEAAWEWRFHFDIHWGEHAVDALRALHRACGRTTE